MLRGQKVKRTDVAVKTGYSLEHIIGITSNYQKNGLAGIVDNHYVVSHARNESIEQICKKIRKRGLRNEISQTSDKVVDRLRNNFSNGFAEGTGNIKVIKRIMYGRCHFTY